MSAAVNKPPLPNQPSPALTPLSGTPFHVVKAFNPPSPPTPLPLQAICWAWELSTVVFRLPPERVWVSVFEEDEEALAIWRDVVGVDPSRIRKMGADDNFWASGPTGEGEAGEEGLEGRRGCTA